MTLSADGNVAHILQGFGGNPQRAEDLAAFLGFEPISNPEDRLAGALSGGLKQFLRGQGRRRLRSKRALSCRGLVRQAPAEAGLWIGVLSDWGFRSSDRDRARRRVTRALVEHVPDRRSLALLVPSTLPIRAAKQSLSFPAPKIGSYQWGCNQRPCPPRSGQPHSVPPGPPARAAHHSRRVSLLDVSRLWQQEFSVERVTTKFYQQYAAVRDRMAKALLAHNPDHPVIESLSEEEARAWATRQMGRVLFLWFLQAKRWLGEPGGMGSPTYLLNSVGQAVRDARGRILSRHSWPRCSSMPWQLVAAAVASTRSWDTSPT